MASNVTLSLQSQQISQHQQPPQPSDLDAIHNKQLIPQLRESLANLMKIAGQLLHQNATTDDSLKSIEGQQQRLERTLEEFYSICDQLEVNLRLNLESVQQNADSSKFLPLQVNVPKDNNQLPEGQSLQYSQYLQITKQQISCAKEVHDLLLKFSKKVTDR
ncbi:mediator of RNA polymerase II transcription subunit 29-like [Mytilus californianus]|uniref:Mediator of RNA polymerase II transcription subunit 29 n=1 Tax=Mytilus coruscus TaxID=42192 RepID=A0A6J8BD98_MYTCO|nr:mediator of RNA polymerase II transcription subunit 29-like [Mytilus californianus]CAC5381885.1 MED29 [Mytilus coruscus]